ncbi:MAG TPA: translocation/assembly module TamB domain-containing protein, partial [bacterium]|nr:translocation/assembly module TamB domain-containing protein [bacterium]
MYYNPFTRVVRINANEPLFLDIQGNRLLVHGTIALQEGGRPPQLNLHIDTPFREGVPIALPIDTVLAPGGPFEAEGGIETISLRVTGPAISPVIQGNVQLALRNIRMLGQPIFQSMGGTLQFEYAPGDEPGEVRSRRLVFPERQFRITNTDGDQSGTVYVVGEIDYPSLAGIRQVGEGQQIGHLALVPSEPGTILPITGFGMQSGLVFQEGSEPLAVQLTSAGIQLSGDLILAPGRLDLRRLPNFGAAVEGGAVVPVPLVFNLRTRFPDGFEVVGPSDLDVELDPGTLTISGNPLAPTVVGRIVARRGSFAVLGREFELTEPATLTFDGIYGLNPLLTAVAETTIEAPDPTALSGRNRVTITVSVSARLQELGDEASP